MATKRKTKDGHVLRPNEYERKGKRGFEFKYRDEYGHQHTLGALTLQELREKERAIQRDISDGINIAKQQTTLNDFYKLWKSQKRGLKPNTFANYIYMYEKFIANTIGNIRIAELKQSDIIGLYINLYDKGIQVNTIDSLQTVLHQVIDKALHNDAVRRNVSDGALKELKQAHPREKKKALTIEEQKRFQSVIRETEWFPIFTIMIYTGMRVGEITGLTWDDIDEAERIIHVRRTLVYYKDQTTGRMERRINNGKTPAAFRDLPMNDAIRDALQYQKEHGTKCHTIVDGIDGFIFATRFGDAHGQHTLNKALKRIVKNANDEKDAPIALPYITCHTLRRTYATNLVRAGLNIAVVMYLMGHSDTETTITIYTDVQKDMATAGDEKLQEWLSGRITDETVKEYAGMGNVAQDIIRITKKARDEMEQTGAISAHRLAQLQQFNITADDI